MPAARTTRWSGFTVVSGPGRGLTPGQRLRRTLAQALAAAGLTEVLSYPFLSRSINDRLGSVDGQPQEQITLANPLDATAGQLRISLLPGLVQVAARNRSRGLTDLAVYELGSVFLPAAGRPFGSGALPAGGARPCSGPSCERSWRGRCVRRCGERRASGRRPCCGDRNRRRR